MKEIDKETTGISPADRAAFAEHLASLKQQIKDNERTAKDLLRLRIQLHREEVRSKKRLEAEERKQNEQARRQEARDAKLLLHFRLREYREEFKRRKQQEERDAKDLLRARLREHRTSIKDQERDSINRRKEEERTRKAEQRQSDKEAKERLSSRLKEHRDSIREQNKAKETERKQQEKDRKEQERSRNNKSKQDTRQNSSSARDEEKYRKTEEREQVRARNQVRTQRRKTTFAREKQRIKEAKLREQAVRRFESSEESNIEETNQERRQRDREERTTNRTFGRRRDSVKKKANEILESDTTKDVAHTGVNAIAGGEAGLAAHILGINPAKIASWILGLLGGKDKGTDRVVEAVEEVNKTLEGNNKNRLHNSFGGTNSIKDRITSKNRGMVSSTISGEYIPARPFVNPNSPDFNNEPINPNFDRLGSPFLRLNGPQKRLTGPTTFDNEPSSPSIINTVESLSPTEFKNKPSLETKQPSEFWKSKLQSENGVYSHQPFGGMGNKFKILPSSPVEDSTGFDANLESKIRFRSLRDSALGTPDSSPLQFSRETIGEEKIVEKLVEIERTDNSVLSKVEKLVGEQETIVSTDEDNKHYLYLISNYLEDIDKKTEQKGLFSKLFGGLGKVLGAIASKVGLSKLIPERAAYKPTLKEKLETKAPTTGGVQVTPGKEKVAVSTKIKEFTNKNKKGIARTAVGAAGAVGEYESLKSISENGLTGGNLLGATVSGGAMGASVGSLFGPIGTMVGGLVGAGLGVIAAGITSALTPEEKKSISDAMDNISGFFAYELSKGMRGLIDGIETIYFATKTVGSFLLDGTVDGVKRFGKWAMDVGSTIADGAKVVKQWGENFGSTVLDGVKSVGDWFKEINTKTSDWVKNIDLSWVTSIGRAFLDGIKTVGDFFDTIGNFFKDHSYIFNALFGVTEKDDQIKNLQQQNADLNSKLGNKPVNETTSTSQPSGSTSLLGSSTSTPIDLQGQVGKPVNSGFINNVIDFFSGSSSSPTEHTIEQKNQTKEITNSVKENMTIKEKETKGKESAQYTVPHNQQSIAFMSQDHGIAMVLGGLA